MRSWRSGRRHERHPVPDPAAPAGAADHADRRLRDFRGRAGADPRRTAGRHVAPMSIFHAFYVMSYTATTIGFGEVPHPFSDAQRLWVTFSIYLSVIGWAYTLGSVIALTNDVTFRTMLTRSAYRRRVRDVTEPFYVLCGYGQSGSRLARALDRLGNRHGHRRAQRRARRAYGDPGLLDATADPCRGCAPRRRAGGQRHPQRTLPRPGRHDGRRRRSIRRSPLAPGCSIRRCKLSRVPSPTPHGSISSPSVVSRSSIRSTPSPPTSR